MYHHGWLYIEDSDGPWRELFNHARTAAYLTGSAALGCGRVYNVLDDGGCEAYRYAPIADVLIDEVDGLPIFDETTEEWLIEGDGSPSGWLQQVFVDPVSDPAPWYNPAFPESGQALGFWVQEWTGLDSGHVQRQVTQLGGYGGGGTFGAMGSLAREMGFEVILLGESEAALDYLYRWLDATLTSVCATCSSDTIVLRRICPDLYAPDGQISSTWNLTVGFGNANTSGAAVFLGGDLYLNDNDSTTVSRDAALGAIVPGQVISIGDWSFTVATVQDNATHWKYTGTASGPTPTDGLVSVVSETFNVTDGVVEMRGVGLVSGMTWGAPPIEKQGCFIRSVNFTLGAMDPCMYGLCSDVPISQNMTWATCFAAANINTVRSECRPSCSEMDGTCRLVFDYTVDDPSAMAPILTMVAPTSDVDGSYPMRVRTYANPFGLLPAELCGLPLVGELYVSSLPSYTELRYDVARRRVEIRNAGTGGWINGFSYLGPNEPGVPRFFGLGCGDYTTIVEPADFCVATAPASTREFSEVTLELRTRMGCA